MDQQLTSYIIFHKDNCLPATPQLRLELTATNPNLWVDTSYSFQIAIHRDVDSHQSPCIFNWSAYANGFCLVPPAFILFQHTPNGFERVEISDKKNNLIQPDELFVNGWNQSLWELAPGGSIKFLESLSFSLQQALIPGQRYELFWAGCEIPMWEWGTIRGHLNQKLYKKLPTGLKLPGGSSISFDVQMERERPPFPRPVSPLPIEASARIPGAPKLSVTLECASSMPMSGVLTVTAKVTYENTSDSTETANPIIFHKYAFEAPDTQSEGYRLYRRRHNVWKSFDYEDDDDDDDDGGAAGMFLIVDDPDISVNVSRHEDFVSLRPGEYWTTSQTISVDGMGWKNLPDDRAVGEIFRYRFKGATVEWWDWGDSKDHAETVVKLPCWIKGHVTEPADNNKRPKLVVPASNIVEFVVVE